MTDEPTRIPAELEIPTGPNARLLLRRYTAPNGAELVAVAPQIMGRDGQWRLKHSGLLLAPAAARALGPALAGMADKIEADTQTGEGNPWVESW